MLGNWSPTWAAEEDIPYDETNLMEGGEKTARLKINAEP